MRLIKKGDKIHKSILTHVYFRLKSLKFLRIIHKNNSIYCISFLESLNQIHRETRKKLQQEQASKKISDEKNDKVHISIFSIKKTKKWK